MKKPVIACVVAIGRNRELGYKDKLLWHIPDDLKRFKRLTLGHPIIMGRKTFESIVGYLGHPLPGRTNIVVTREQGFLTRLNLGNSEVIATDSLERALAVAKEQPGSEEIHIGGGAEIYRQAMPYITKLCLTLIDDSKEADAFFPEYEKEFTKKTFEESREHEGLKYRWVDLER